MDYLQRINKMEFRRVSHIVDEKRRNAHDYDYNSDLEKYYYDRKRLNELACYYVYYQGYSMEKAAQKAREILQKEKRKK